MRRMFFPGLVALLAAAALIATPAAATDETSISGTFNGCEWDKTYPLLDGRTLICRGYKYHYAYAPKVIVKDSFTVIIDGEEYSAWVR